MKTLELQTMLPLEEMYSYVVRVKYRDRYWYVYAETLILEEAKVLAKIDFIQRISKSILIQEIKCKKIMWHEWFSIYPDVTWEEYKKREML